MYVLYYFESDYDYHEKEMLAVSSSREKLEAKKQEMIAEWNKAKKLYKKWDDLRQKAYVSYGKRCKKFLLKNLDAIRNYTRKDGLWLKEKRRPDDVDGFWGQCRIRASGCGDFDEPEPPPSEFIPFSKEEENYVKKQRIDYICSYHGQHLENELFMDKLNGPLPKMTPEELKAIDCSKAPPYSSYDASSLIIEEIQEI